MYNEKFHHHHHLGSFPTSVPIPPVGATAAQSCIAFQQFIDIIALNVGMKNSNLVIDTNAQRLYGFFDGLPGNLADRFEAEISRYPWNLLPVNRSVGKFVTGEGRTTMTNIRLGPFR